MQLLELLMWLCFAIVFYSFVGYGIVLWVIVKIKQLFSTTKPQQAYNLPDVTLVVPCCNQADVIEEKIGNSLELDYPKSKLHIMFITDGSTDNSPEILSRYPAVEALHTSRHAGNIASQNRAMQHVRTPLVIFSDANTLLDKHAVQNIVRHFADERVGCVAGEKRISVNAANLALAAGESWLCKYDSLLNKLDSKLHSAVGAAGDLVAYRTSLYEAMLDDTILNHFTQSMYIAAKGYKTVYEPRAYAVETASASTHQEVKRKVRISEGRWQSIAHLRSRLSFTKAPVLYFQFFSHRVLQWTVNPFFAHAYVLLQLTAKLPSRQPL